MYKMYMRMYQKEVSVWMMERMRREYFTLPVVILIYTAVQCRAVMLSVF